MENLRLQAAEQSMARKLQREKERTRRLVGEAEAAVSDHCRNLLEYSKVQNEKDSHRGMLKLLYRGFGVRFYRRLEGVLKLQVAHLFPLGNAPNIRISNFRPPCRTCPTSPLLVLYKIYT